jgi:hypothetical protein
MKITRFALVMMLVCAFSLSLFAQDSTKTMSKTPKHKTSMSKGMKSSKAAKSDSTKTKSSKMNAKGTKMKKGTKMAPKDSIKTMN